MVDKRGIYIYIYIYIFLQIFLANSIAAFLVSDAEDGSCTLPRNVGILVRN
jgi:hypothetical protein